MTLPPIPEGSAAPRWMQTLYYTLRPLEYMEQCAQRAGDIFNAPVIGNVPTVLFVSHPKAIQTIFAPDTRQITSPPNQLLMPVLGDRSIFCMEGARHLRERKLLMPPFHRENLPHYGALICQLTDRAMQQVSPGNIFVAREMMQDISLEVILKVVFGMAGGSRSDTLKALIVELTDGFQNPLMGGALFFPVLQRDFGSLSPWGKFLSVKRRITQVLMDEIRDRRSQDITDRSDILTLLMAARDEEGQPMSDDELRDELLTLLVAGHETTATAVAWALYWIHRDRHVQETLLAELHSLGDEPDPMAIAQLPYLTAVCNEAMRIYPVVMMTVPREVREPMNLMGYPLETGTRLYGCIYLTHRRPDLYPDPETFRPERFLERQFSMYEFLPFGGGSRRCIGEVLAQFEAKLVIATLMRHYDLELADSTPEVPKRRGVTLAPDRGVRMVLKSAHPNQSIS